MKTSVKEAIDSLLDLRDQCCSVLETKINSLIVSVENQNKPDYAYKENVRREVNEVKDWMSLYHLWVDNAADSLYNEYVGEERK